MTTKQTKIVVDHNMHTLVMSVLRAAEAGWRLVDEPPVGLYGFLYEATMEFEGEEEPVEKPTRAEILAKARASKAARRSTVEASEALPEASAETE